MNDPCGVPAIAEGAVANPLIAPKTVLPLRLYRPFRFRRKNIGVGYRSDERVFCQIFMVLRDNGFCFFQRGKPPLNLKIFVSSNAFDNSSFFYK